MVNRQFDLAPKSEWTGPFKTSSDATTFERVIFPMSYVPPLPPRNRRSRPTVSIEKTYRIRDFFRRKFWIKIEDGSLGLFPNRKMLGPFKTFEDAEAMRNVMEV